jgi:hypothetical protein
LSPNSLDVETNEAFNEPRFANIRTSSTLNTHPNYNMAVGGRTSRQTSSRPLEGTNLDSYNSISVLENDDIYTRALEMGVDLSSFSLEKIDCLKDLELARDNLEHKKCETLEPESLGPTQVLLLGFGEETDEEGFTLVVLRRTRKQNKSVVNLKKPRRQVNS